MNDSTGAVSAHPAGEFTNRYHPPPHLFDEMRTAAGEIRPAWKPLARTLDELQSEGLSNRTEQARRLLRENGVTYNVYGASQDLERPWELDPLPLLIARSEWEELSTAVRQRARLLDRLLADVYGPQELLKSGVIPPDLLFRHPGYLHPCVGISPPSGTFLHFYAAQLARDSQGTWLLLGDRGQGASGAGYSVENRIVVSRTLPQHFQNLNVVRLASFFKTLQNTLNDQAAHHRDNPRVVLLSPGPSSSRYFEDVYLARYLGYTLVEGGDLTVRGDGVFLKTLGGLLQIDVILRRVIDADCDPLELNPNSWFGIPGLVQAVRDGQVVVANALGSGFLEAPVLQAFLPEICKFLLGENLKLNAPRTWWCADADSLGYVETHLDQLIVRSAFEHRKLQSHHGWLLSADQKSELLSRMRANPARFIAQEAVSGSTAPVWTGRDLEPWHITLRTFAVSVNGDYQVMPGGLSRAASNADMLAESMAAGQRSKDVWILSDQPVETVTLLRPARSSLELRRSGNDLPSRAADHLFWLGRVMERAESFVRHSRSIIARLTSELQPAGIAELLLLTVALDEPGESPLGMVTPEDPMAWALLRDAVWAFLYQPSRKRGLHDTLQTAHRTASIVRDRISIDSWRIINQLDLQPPMIRETGGGAADLGESLLPLNQLLMLISAFSGLSADSMTRGPGWRFLDIGRRIERALQTIRILDGLLVDVSTDLLPRLEAMLEIADSSMTYRYRYLTTLQLAPVLDLVLIDETNPRAVGFQLAALAEHLRSLNVDGSAAVRRPEQKLVLSSQAALRLADVESLSSVDGVRDRIQLREFLKQLTTDLHALAETMTHTYLTHTVSSRQLETMGVESRPIDPVATMR
ncbi:MAG: circularly permuted type 2 ATP-grasp protein [Planctomycetales bacterium]